jgi:hypothetical protein
VSQSGDPKLRPEATRGYDTIETRGGRDHDEQPIVQNPLTTWKGMYNSLRGFVRGPEVPKASETNSALESLLFGRSLDYAELPPPPGSRRDRLYPNTPTSYGPVPYS